MYCLKNFNDSNKIKEILSSYEYVSFDMFDTLVKRDCFKPTELFTFLEKRIDEAFQRKSNFAEIRINAEIKARKDSTKEEITFDEIYRYLRYSFSKEELCLIKKWELEYEFMLCQLNPLIKPIYDYCILNNKKILVVTDIYLPENIIRKILIKIGIKYTSLFVSSTYKLTKQSGNLFKKVLLTLSISSSDVIHIGDNKKSDYRIPKRMGINAVCIKRNTMLNFVVKKNQYKKNQSYADLCSFISNHFPRHIKDVYLKTTEDHFSQIGYEVEGPVLYGFIQWLQKEVYQNKINKIFFLARDGQLIQRAYRKLPKNISNEYMYASRKAFIIPTIWMKPELSDLRNIMFWPRRGTIPTFLKKIGLKPNDFEEVFTNAEFDYKQEYIYRELWENRSFIDIYNSFIKKAAVKNSRSAYKLLVTYMKQIHFEGKVAIVDIGWFGHMQLALQRVIQASGLKIELHGYYIGLRYTSPLLREINAKGYLFDENLNRESSIKEATFNALVEALFTANHGTTSGFLNCDNIIKPILEEWEYQNKSLMKDYKYIQSAQEGALAFVDDVLNESEYFDIGFDSTISFINWLYLGCTPSKKSADYFGDLHMLDDKFDFMAKPKNYIHYLLNPLELKQDILDSHWRIGFLTRLFGDLIPYYKLYSYLRKTI